MPSEERESLRENVENVEKAEQRLAAAVGEVCADPVAGGGVGKPNTGELIRLDETLALASKATKQAIAARRRLRAESQKNRDNGPRSDRRAD
jgi:hypothetical protein